MNQQELLQTIEVLKSATLDSAVITPDAQKDFNLSSGMQAYNLEAGAKFLFPVMSPLRNLLPRVGGKGRQVEYKAITGINTGNDQGWVAEGVSGNIVSTSFTDIYSIYKTISQADKVTFEQQWAGASFIDSKATAVANLLRSVMITEEKDILFGQNTVAASNQQAPGAVGACPIPTLAASGTGSSLAAGTVHVKIVAHTGVGRSLPSADTTQVVTAGQNVVITFPKVAGQPILGFSAYVSTDGANYFKVAVANLVANSVLGGTVNNVTMTSNGAPVTVVSAPTTGEQPPASDGSANVNAYNGLLAQIFGGAGATISNVNGTLAKSNGKNGLDDHLLNMWNSSFADPDLILVNGVEGTKITNMTLGAGGTPYFVMVDQQNGATGSYRVARYTNPVTGTEIPIKAHPYLPQGTLLTLSTKLPSWYVPSDIPAPMAIDACQDYTEIDYSPVFGTRAWPVEVMLYSTFKLYIPLLQGALTGIQQG
jgi:hypothetical protein